MALLKLNIEITIEKEIEYLRRLFWFSASEELQIGKVAYIIEELDQRTVGKEYISISMRHVVTRQTATVFVTLEGFEEIKKNIENKISRFYKNNCELLMTIL